MRPPPKTYFERCFSSVHGSADLAVLLGRNPLKRGPLVPRAPEMATLRGTRNDSAQEAYPPGQPSFGGSNADPDVRSGDEGNVTVDLCFGAVLCTS